MPVEWVKHFSAKFNRVSFRDPCLLQDAQVFTVEGQGTRVADHWRSIPKEDIRIDVIILVLGLSNVRTRYGIIPERGRRRERGRIQELENSAARTVSRENRFTRQIGTNTAIESDQIKKVICERRI